MLEVGKMPVNGEADETLLMDAADLVEEAMGTG
jgi:ATP-dependent Lhr-like helicase